MLYWHARNSLIICAEDHDYGSFYGWNFDIFGMIYSVYTINHDKPVDKHVDILNNYLSMMHEYIIRASLIGLVRLNDYVYVDDNNDQGDHKILIKYVPIFPINKIKLLIFIIIDATIIASIYFIIKSIF